jgi:tetratricopeptide (TPR) repeat protein
MSKLQIGNVILDNNVILAPMAGVSDLPFRLLCREQGAGLVCMEMISAKAIYYNNLADVCWLLGDNAAADIWCEKMLRIYQDMPQSKFRKHLDSTALISSAERSYRNEDYSMAMLTLNQAELKNTRAKVSAALLRAQIYIKAGNVENARKELDYVISNGNKCYDVTRAKEILNNID